MEPHTETFELVKKKIFKSGILLWLHLLKTEYNVFCFDLFCILLQFSDAEALMKKSVGKRAMNNFGPYLDAVETIFRTEVVVDPWWINYRNVLPQIIIASFRCRILMQSAWYFRLDNYKWSRISTCWGIKIAGPPPPLQPTPHGAQKHPKARFVAYLNTINLTEAIFSIASSNLRNSAPKSPLWVVVGLL